MIEPKVDCLHTSQIGDAVTIEILLVAPRTSGRLVSRGWVSLHQAPSLIRMPAITMFCFRRSIENTSRKSFSTDIRSAVPRAVEFYASDFVF